MAVSNVTDAIDGINWANVIMGVPNIGDLIAIGKAVGIAVLVYITFLIIRSITQILYSRRFKKLSEDVDQINKKMDSLISAVGGKINKKEEKKR
jgi:hypothetical protein